MVSYNLVVSCNNLTALRQFNVFLTNYLLWENPSFLAKWLVKKARAFVHKEAMKAFREIRNEISLNKVSLGLNDCPTPLFASLYVASQSFEPESGDELFLVLADAELQLEKMKKPRLSGGYGESAPVNLEGDNPSA